MTDTIAQEQAQKKVGLRCFECGVRFVAGHGRPVMCDHCWSFTERDRIHYPVRYHGVGPHTHPELDGIAEMDKKRSGNGNRKRGHGPQEQRKGRRSLKRGE